MYKGFNVTNLERFRSSSEFNDWKQKGSVLYLKDKKLVQPKLMEFIVNSTYIDADRIKQNWFPTEIKNKTMHVFISHSHKDEDLALALAGLLSQLGVNVFIDSCIWGYADDLLQQIDELNCVKSRNEDDSITYSYKKRNGSTSHVHMMLANALTTMMDQTECVLFLNTSQSINVNFGQEIKNKTYSPWIFHEISMTRFLRANDISYTRYKTINECMTMDSTPIAHSVDVSHLIEIPYIELLNKIQFAINKDPDSDKAFKFLNDLYLFEEFYKVKRKRQFNLFRG